MDYCLDISAAPYGTGVSRYTTNLALALQDQTPEGDRFSVFGSSLRQFPELNSYAGRLNTVKKHLYPIPPRITSQLFNQLNFPIDPLIGKVDLFHSWDWYLPVSRRAVVVTTVHDLALFKYPDTAHPDIKAHHQLVMERIKTHGTFVIAVSEATKQDLVNLFGIQPDHVRVIYEALPKESKINPTSEEIDLVKRKHHIDKPYMLMVGTQEPRKNFPRQIEAWRSIKQDFNVVIAGRPGWETIPEEDGLQQLGYIEENELACLYCGAAALMYCSLDEGFGLPILEAFYHRVPVVTSDISSLSEIANGAAIKVDPLQVDAIIAGIRQAIDQKDALVDKGNERLKDFSWDSTATQTIEFYRHVLDARK